MELLDGFFHSYFNLYLNLGLWCGMVMGILLLLRPVLCRLLTPGQRVFLWGVGWIGGFAPQLFLPLARISLPVPTLRSLLIPRAERGWSLFMPVMQEAGTYRLVLPGGATIPFSITQEGIDALGWLGLLFLAVTLFLAARSDWGVKRMARSGTELDREQYRRLRVDQEDNLVVRLCPNLPTSFVVRSWGRHEIALQKELTEEQLRLVLLHEREHVSRHDPWLQGLAVVVVCIFFWNPVVWLAYHFTRRDMELACDRRVLRRLGEEERRAYAHTLVDLACDKPRWGGLTTFGECDASRRVKAATRWVPEDESDDLEPRRLLGWVVVLLLAASLFLGGPWDRALTVDLVSDLERDGGWTWLAGEMAEQHVVPDEEEPLWIRGDGSSYAKIYILDEEGTWWSALIRRNLYGGHLDAHLMQKTVPDTPDLSGCDPISWEETEGTSGAA